MLRIKSLNPPDPKKVPLATYDILNPKKRGLERAWENPFKQAFLVHNPTIKRKVVSDRNKPDTLLRSLNEGRPFNLLKCSKRFTLVVSQFHCGSVLQSRSGDTSLDKLGLGSRPANLVDASARNAENVAEFIHKYLKQDTYVLHTRYYSLVTVGGFDRLDDPLLYAKQRQLAAIKLDPIPMLAQPVPMEIPRP
jgi:hypothetical protein